MQNVFLHGTLHEIIYMDLSPDIIDRERTLYVDSTNPFMLSNMHPGHGFQTFSHVIKSIGFQQSKTDYSLFTRLNNSSFTALLIYADDILLTGNDLTEIQRVKDLENIF